VIPLSSLLTTRVSPAPGIAYTLIWPILPLAPEEPLTRDFLPGVTQQREQRFIAFINDEKRDVLAQLIAEEESRKQKQMQDASKVEQAVAVASGREGHTAHPNPQKKKLPLRLFTPYKLIRSNLSRKEFFIEENINIADIWWLYDRFRHVSMVFPFLQFSNSVPTPLLGLRDI